MSYIEGNTFCMEHVESIYSNIRDFKILNSFDKVIIVNLWETNKCCSEVSQDVNTTSAELMDFIDEGHREISSFTIYAVAAALEGCSYINGSPQNTFVTGLRQLAQENGVVWQIHYLFDVYSNAPFNDRYLLTNLLQVPWYRIEEDMQHITQEISKCMDINEMNDRTNLIALFDDIFFANMFNQKVENQSVLTTTLEIEDFDNVNYSDSESGCEDDSIYFDDYDDSEYFELPNLVSDSNSSETDLEYQQDFLLFMTNASNMDEIHIEDSDTFVENITTNSFIQMDLSDYKCRIPDMETIHLSSFWNYK